MCLDAGEFELFAVSDSLGERIRVFSVGNVERIFENWFTLIIGSSQDLIACLDTT